MNSTITPGLLARYFSGDCAGEEEATVRAWLFESPVHAAQAEAWLELAGRSAPHTMSEVLKGRNDVRNRVDKSITDR